MKVGVFTSQNKQKDLGIPQGKVLSVTIFLVAINGILGELGNGVDGLVANTALHGVTNKLDAWAEERRLSFSPSKSVNVILRKRRNHTLYGK